MAKKAKKVMNKSDAELAEERGAAYDRKGELPQVQTMEELKTAWRRFAPLCLEHWEKSQTSKGELPVLEKMQANIITGSINVGVREVNFDFERDGEVWQVTGSVDNSDGRLSHPCATDAEMLTRIMADAVSADHGKYGFTREDVALFCDMKLSLNKTKIGKILTRPDDDPLKQKLVKAGFKCDDRDFFIVRMVNRKTGGEIKPYGELHAKAACKRCIKNANGGAYNRFKKLPNVRSAAYREQQIGK